MPCHDPRDRPSEDALKRHHDRLEKLIRTWLKNVKVPKVWRQQYADEKKRYRAEAQKIEKGDF